MTLQEMLSKMTPQMLMQGLKQISQGLSEEQLKQAENVIKESGLSEKISETDKQSIQSFLSQNPKELKALAGNKELISKLEKIVKNK